MALKPVLQALLLADQIYIDGRTGKKVIAGTFNHLSSSDFPTQSSTKKFAFLSLTDLHGAALVGFRYVDLQSGETMLEIKQLKIEASDPLDTVEMVVELPRLPMPHAGVFAFEAYANDALLGCLRVIVSRADEGEEE